MISVNMVEAKKSELKKMKTQAIVAKARLTEVWESLHRLDGFISDHGFSVKLDLALRAVENVMDDVLLDENFYNAQMIQVGVRCDKEKHRIYEYLVSSPTPISLYGAKRDDGLPVDPLNRIAQALNLHLDMVVWAYTALQKEGKIKEENNTIIAIKKEEAQDNVPGRAESATTPANS